MRTGCCPSRFLDALTRCVLISTTAFFCLALFSPAVASPPQSAEKTKRPKIGLALGGGGAKGSAHLGVIKVLEELRIPVDYIAGTSMGAIVGALYASGMSHEKMEEVLTKVDWDDIFKDSPDRREIDFRRKQEDFTVVSKLAVGVKDGKIMVPRGVIAGQKVDLLFKTLMINAAGTQDFDKLPIPYRAVAADLETGEMVVIGSGDIADAARASMSLPGVFPPAEIKGKLYTDGGIVRNLPVDVVRQMGADVIIAVDVGQPLPGRETLTSPLAIMNQMIDIMIKKNVQDQIDSLRDSDVFIHPKLGDITSADFKRGAEAARIGEEAARKHISELSRYSVSAGEYGVFIAHHRRPEAGSVKIASVRVEGLERVSVKAVEEKINLKPGDTVTTSELSDRVGLVYGMDDFERVGIEITPRGDAYDLTVRPHEKYWGPSYLRAGLRLATNFEGDSSFDLAVEYTMRWLNSLGGEWKNFIQFGNRTGVLTEFDQPLVPNRLFFVAPYASWNQRNWNIFVNDKSVAQYRFRQLFAGVDVGIQPYNYGEGRIGVRFGKGSASLRTGDPRLSDADYTIGAVTGRFVLDQVDNVNFPTKGYLGRISLYSSMKGLGADYSYNKLEAVVGGALTWGTNTLWSFLKYGSRIGNDLPNYDLFTLGGFLNLSGLYPEQLYGQAYGIGGVALYRQMGKSVVGTVYLGGSFEAGNTWHRGESPDFNDLVYAGSVFVGADTILGPAYLALGYAEGGRTSLYFYIGKAFTAF